MKEKLINIRIFLPHDVASDLKEFQLSYGENADANDILVDLIVQGLAAFKKKDKKASGHNACAREEGFYLL